MTIDSKERFKLRKFISELGSYRARHTELISVYIPQSYDIVSVQQQLAGEAGTARNIKSSATRKNVQDALERMIRTLKLHKRTPAKGLAIFAGNVAEREGQSDVQVWEIEPPAPMKTKVYRCDQTFFLDPLKEFVTVKEAYGLVVLDRQEANIALLKGKAIIPIKDFQSIVPGDTRKGGQCLNPETLIPLTDGRIIEIANIDKHQVFASDINQHTIQTTKCVDKWVTTKPKQFTIETKFPKASISASADHLFFVPTDEGIIDKPADELTKNDYLLMTDKLNVKGKTQKINTTPYLEYKLSKAGRELLKNKRLELNLLQRELAEKSDLTRSAISAMEVGRISPSCKYLKKIVYALNLNYNSFIKQYRTQKSRASLPTVINEDFAQILGYLIGDGSMENTRISFFEPDKQLIHAYKKKIEELFKIKTSLRFRKSKNYYQLRIHSIALVNLIQSKFPEIRKSLDTTIPQLICKSPDKVVAGFLRGLFDAEGYMSTKLAIGMNNKKLLQEARLLLLRFGIICSIHKYDNRRNPYSNNPRYTLEIGEKESTQIFLKNIGFESRAKMNKLQNRISEMSEQSYVRRVPVKGRYIRKLAKKIGLTPKDFSRVSNFFNNKRDMSKLVFERSVVPIFNKRVIELSKIKFNGNIREYRQKLRLLLRELAEGINSDKSTLSSMERGIYNSRYKQDAIIFLKKKHRELSEISKEVKKELEIIRNSNLAPLRIVNIRNSTKKNRLIDISTRAENFFADGILVHNSAARFARVREGLLKDWFKKVGDFVNQQFLENKEIKGIIIGGPGPNKENFFNGSFLATSVKEKVLGIVDIGYTGEQGLEEAVAKSEDLLAKEEVMKEKAAVQQMLDLLSKKPSFVAYGEAEVKKALEMGAVATLLISEDVDDKEVEKLAEKCEQFKGNWIIISTDTKEGVQLKNLSGFAAILRYPIG